MRRGFLALMVLLLASCIGGSCLGTPGGTCNPSTDDIICPETYYCAKAEVCTKRCRSDDDCRVPCADGGDCDPPRQVTCQGGYCLREDSELDPYGPSDFGEEN